MGTSGLPGQLCKPLERVRGEARVQLGSVMRRHSGSLANPADPPMSSFSVSVSVSGTNPSVTNSSLDEPLSSRASLRNALSRWGRVGVASHLVRPACARQMMKRTSTRDNHCTLVGNSCGCINAAPSAREAAAISSHSRLSRRQRFASASVFCGEVSTGADKEGGGTSHVILFVRLRRLRPNRRKKPCLGELWQPSSAPVVAGGASVICLCSDGKIP